MAGHEHLTCTYLIRVWIWRLDGKIDDKDGSGRCTRGIFTLRKWIFHMYHFLLNVNVCIWTVWFDSFLTKIYSTKMPMEKDEEYHSCCLFNWFVRHFGFWPNKPLHYYTDRIHSIHDEIDYDIESFLPFHLKCCSSTPFINSIHCHNRLHKFVYQHLWKFGVVLSLSLPLKDHLRNCYIDIFVTCMWLYLQFHKFNIAVSFGLELSVLCVCVVSAETAWYFAFI